VNYSRHYSALIERARRRLIVGYSERHHIVPRCLGGDDSAGNLVYLTPEEHFVAHLLLVKMHPGNRKIALAAMAMKVDSPKTKRKVLSNKQYGWVRQRFSEAMRGHVVSEETREKIRKSLTGRKLSDELKAKVGAFHKGRKRPPETIARMRAAQLGKRHSLETIAKLRLVNGRVWSEEQKAARRAYRHTEEALRKIAAAGVGRKKSAATLEKMRGFKHSPESIAKMRIAAVKREAIRRERREMENAY